MKYAILRTQKLKHKGSIRRSLKHSFREQETPNADSSLVAENSHHGAHSTREAMAAIEALLPEKRRKDAVLAVEYLITGSPEAMHAKSREQQDAYFDDALKWLQERHGEENVVYAGVHRDETTPHMYAYVVPLDPDSGRLNAKRWLGGSKALNAMQTDFAKRVGQNHDLERGIEGSKAKHQSIKRHYAAVQETEQGRATIMPTAMEPRVLKKGFFRSEVESPEAVAARITEGVNKGFAPTIAKAAESEQNARRAREMADTAKSKQAALEKVKHENALLKRPWQGLTRGDMQGLISQADSIRKQREAERQEREKRVQQERAAAERRSADERMRRFEEQAGRRNTPRKAENAPESREKEKPEQTPTQASKRPRGPGMSR